MFTSGYQQITTTFNELNSTGQISLIKDDTLRNLVIAYYQFTETIQTGFLVNDQNVFYPQIFPIIQ